MEIRRFPSDLLASNMYVITEAGHAVVIDPCRNIMPAEGFVTDLILLTHEHYDHISGVNLWKNRTGAEVLCSEACAENINSARKNLAHIFQAFCELQTWIELESVPDFDPEYSCAADRTFENEMTFDWMGHRFRLTELPGHSQGSTGIFLDEKYFFSGDSLLEGKETELRFPGGSRTLWNSVSLPKLSALPDGVRVYPGHFAEFIYHRK